MCSIGAVTSTHIASKYAKSEQQLKNNRAMFEKSITTSDTLDAMPDGKKFILKHTVPKEKKYAVISVFSEKTVKVLDYVNRPYTDVKFGVSRDGYLETSVTRGVIGTYEPRDAIKKVFNETVICNDNFGMNDLTPKFYVNIDSLLRLRAVHVVSDYGDMRDLINRDYEKKINLDNVGKVFADIYDCSGKTLFFGAEKIGSLVMYDSIALNASDIVSGEYDGQIVSSSIGKYFFGVLAVCLGTSALFDFVSHFSWEINIEKWLIKDPYIFVYLLFDNVDTKEHKATIFAQREIYKLWYRSDERRHWEI